MDSLFTTSPFQQELADFDISPNHSAPYDSFDYPQDSSSHFPHTPSYQNSPYSALSDLSAFDSGADNLGLYPHELSAPAIDEYDPSEFDLPNSSEDNNFSFGDFPTLNVGNNHPQFSVTPVFEEDSPNALDYSSPASSNGQEDGRRSRASSTSSYMHPSSPHLDLPQNLANLRFESPNFPPTQLPDGPSPPQHKPPSPPQLVIPSSPSPSAHDAPPTINAPDGDGVIMGSGPQLHIVPATPVSGGGGTMASVPFQQTLENLQQGRSSNDWDRSASHVTVQGQGQNQSLQTSQYADQRAFSFPPGSDTNGQSSGMTFASGESQMHRQQHTPSPLPQQAFAPQQPQSFLVAPMAQRSRSLSDTSARPPVWDMSASGMAPTNTGMHQGAGADFDGNIASRSHDTGRGASMVGTVNMNDVLPGPSSTATNTNPTATALHSPPSAGLPRHPSSAGPFQSSFGQLQPPTHNLHHSSFGPGISQYPTPQTANYLSPDFSAALLRRTKSDSQQRGHRLSRSEDLRSSNDFLRPDAMLYPPASQMTRQYLHPSETVPSIASRGHHRRSSSGSRERGLIGGWSSAGSSTRPSPYPSPSASPRPGYGPLPSSPMPEIVPSIGGTRRHIGGGLSVDMGLSSMHAMHSMGGMNGMSGMGMPGQMQSMAGGPGAGMNMPVNMADGVPIKVSKVNVTTPSTADASRVRRKQAANFACPVPGCGSTFTRHFNLKGHLRSHAEEKPYLCKWPGCGKGFARQHDCKRHEQLHLNIRPYPCQGCKKNFARMDALNRHLRSEGGAECRKLQEELTASSGENSANDASAASGMGAPSDVNNDAEPALDLKGTLTMKPDPDGNWNTMAGGVVV